MPKLHGTRPDSVLGWLLAGLKVKASIFKPGAGVASDDAASSTLKLSARDNAATIRSTFKYVLSQERIKFICITRLFYCVL